MGLKNLIENNYENDDIITTSNSDAVDLAGAVSISMQAIVDVDTPVAKTFDSETAEILTVDTIAETGVEEKFVLNFADGAATTQGDYFTFVAPDGDVYAVWLDIDATGTAPTGAAYVAADQKVETDILSTDLDEAIAAKMVAALGAIAGITITDNSDGTVDFEYDTMGVVTDADTHDDDDAGAGSIAVSVTDGVASNLNSTYFHLDSINDSYYVWMNVNSEGVDPAPSGKTGIEVAFAKTSTNSTIATAVAAAIDAKADFGSSAVAEVITITAADVGAVTDCVDEDTGFTVAVTTQGRDSEVQEGAANTVSIPSHGYVTGFKGQLTTTGTLPAGVTTATDYFIIAVDADTVSFAASLALALAGTAIDLTDEGTGVHTFTAVVLAGATLTFQKSNDGSNWDNIASPTSITEDVDIWFEKDRPTYRYFRFSYTLTAGQMSTDNHVLIKGE